MKTIAVFDFDGTLTTRDTLIEFIRFAFGSTRTYLGFLLYSPMILLMMLGIMDNNRCKELLLSHFFKGMEYSRFQQLGKEFANIVPSFLRTEMVEQLKEHLQSGADVYVISASVEEWVKPFCMTLGVNDVLATRLAVDANGLLTGKYNGKNCHGEEKVNRLKLVAPARNTYKLYAYGDSSGDSNMFAFADHYRKI